MKNFYRVVANSLIANVTTSYLWFALVFWVYLETRSVLATGILGGVYMLLIAVCSMAFGSIVDRHRKKNVMLLATGATFVLFAGATIVYGLAVVGQQMVLTNPWLWVFSVAILLGGIVENMRNIALSTVVTLLVPAKVRDKANGLVGTVGGIGFIVTSVFSGLSIGFLGMGWTLVIATALMAVACAHLLTVSIPEEKIVHDPALTATKIDLRGSIAAILAVPGLFALLIFSTFNNLVGGVYMALLDPYGLTIFSVQMWGIVFGIAGTGFVVGGLLVATFGLGKKPIRTLLLTCVVMGVIGALFTIREWQWLFIAGMWLYMLIVPIIEATEQTVIQRVVPFKRQGRVFGFAQAFEASAAPVAAFLIAPIAEFGIIPFMHSSAGQQAFGWLLGSGDARGIALVFLIAGMIMALAALIAMTTKSYRILSESYQAQMMTDEQ